LLNEGERKVLDDFWREHGGGEEFDGGRWWLMSSTVDDGGLKRREDGGLWWVQRQWWVETERVQWIEFGERAMYWVWRGSTVVVWTGFW
jgi:hypothetical protein